MISGLISMFCSVMIASMSLFGVNSLTTNSVSIGAEENQLVAGDRHHHRHHGHHHHHGHHGFGHHGFGHHGFRHHGFGHHGHHGFNHHRFGGGFYGLGLGGLGVAVSGYPKYYKYSYNTPYYTPY